MGVADCIKALQKELVQAVGTFQAAFKHFDCRLAALVTYTDFVHGM